MLDRDEDDISLQNIGVESHKHYQAKPKYVRLGKPSKCRYQNFELDHTNTINQAKPKYVRFGKPLAKLNPSAYTDGPKKP